MAEALAFDFGDPLDDLPETVEAETQVPCPACRTTAGVLRIVSRAGRALWYRCQACGGYGWDA